MPTIRFVMPAGFADRLLVRLDAALEIGLDLLRQHLARADAVADLRVLRCHELVEAASPTRARSATGTSSMKPFVTA